MSGLKRRVCAIPLPLLAVLPLAVPFAVVIVIKWFQLPLPYGEVLGPADPDPWMRLVLVRDLLTSGDWYNHAVARSDAPFFNSVNHWTRPLDVVIATLVKAQPDSVDVNLRLMRAALVLPLLWMLLLLFGVFRILRGIAPYPLTLFAATALIATMPLVWSYFSLANADHHAMLAVVFIWALGVVFEARPARSTIIFSGLLLALLLWISPEAMVLIGIIYGWYGLHWLFGEKERARPWVLLSIVVALGSALAVMIERPPALWFVPAYDVISIVFVVILAYAAALICLLQALPPATMIGRAGLGALGAFGLYGLLWAVFPLMLGGPMAEVDPYILTNFLPNITEAKSPLEHPLLYAAGVLLQPVVGFWILFRYLRKDDGLPSQANVLVLAYLMTTTFALYMSQLRFFYYFYPVLTLILAPAIASLLEPEHPAVAGRWPASWIARYPARRRPVYRLPLLVPLACLPVLLSLLSAYVDPETIPERRPCMNAARALIQAGKLNDLNGGKPLTLFTSTDLGSEVLFFTPHRIIASNYHRDGLALRFVWEAEKMTDPGKLRRRLAERGVDALLLCPALGAPEESVLNRLQQGMTPPDWLSPITYPKPPAESEPMPGSAPVLFRVLPEEGIRTTSGPALR